uniref:Tectonic-1-3 N-terminal domain-containing protein n=1 Tax=Xiphophorus couchianus TaxID=32473 RepID=A0A3B5L0M6_9TELE
MIISRLNSLHVLLLCGRLALSATDIGVTDSTISSQTNGGPFGSPTPTYGVGEQTHPVSRGGSSVAPVTEGVTGASSVAPVIEGVTGASSVAPVTPSVTGATEEATLYPTLVCLCDLTPDFCDIGCCCDTADCDVANLSTVFTGSKTSTWGVLDRAYLWKSCFLILNAKCMHILYSFGLIAATICCSFKKLLFCIWILKFNN